MGGGHHKGNRELTRGAGRARDPAPSVDVAKGLIIASQSVPCIDFNHGQSGLPLVIIMKLLGREETLRRLSDAREFAASEVLSLPGVE